MKFLIGFFAFSFADFLGKEEAESFLVRSKRWVGVFEEWNQGNMERECFEEVCNAEENFEVFDLQEPHRESWSKLKGCSEISSRNGNIIKAELRNCYQRDRRTLPNPK